ncbi:transcriptional regulator with XRE-family HTH domain [Dokdonella fugitiva]|uniref:Transcriptional regulator with XRE-family HTH domain n=1 Tax=Dokdonella fugitiva TaxID=328517 RepID=A0A839EZ52_9GAMM|nr:helix-turn-helix transcriptional regulator [Dokdonella fugitiva]MBA8889997.1 transcriptional regulator with XRE-family HTH domain [Dokdonella fugitiva]
MKTMNSAYVPGARLCDRVRLSRVSSKLSQASLSRKLGVTASAVAQWESARGTTPGVDRIRKIASITGVSFEWLATGEGSAFERRTRGAQESPAVDLDCYAQDLAEELLLSHYRNMKRKARDALLSVAEALAHAAERGSPTVERR